MNLSSAYITNLIAIVGTVVAIGGAILLLIQLKQSYRLARASFIALLNKDLFEFTEIRKFFESSDDISDWNVMKERVEREKLDTIKAEDYFVAFENIYWMIDNKSLTKREAQEYFGSRFENAYKSKYFELRSANDKAFGKRCSLMKDLYQYIIEGKPR